MKKKINVFVDDLEMTTLILKFVLNKEDADYLLDMLRDSEGKAPQIVFSSEW
jgi:hypothetical protein